MTFEFNRANFHEWQSPGRNFTVQLNLDVARRLTKANSESDCDISAVLLGYSANEPERVTIVTDFVLLPDSWDLQGGNYSAKFEDTRAEIVQKLAEGAESGLHPIGFCRWQKGGHLELTGRDFASAQRFFSEPDNVVLLIRRAPRNSEAAFFYWEDGKIQVPTAGTYFSFDFARAGGTQPAAVPSPGLLRDSSEETPVWRFEEGPPATPAEPLPPPPPEAWQHGSREPIRWVRLVPTIALLTVGIAAADWTLTRKAGEPAAPPEVKQTVAAAATIQPVSNPPATAQIPLGLQVAMRGKVLEIHWNHTSPIVQNAAKGVMRISDGGVEEVIQFDVTQLHDGAVAYPPKTNDVSVRFEISGLDGSSVSESVRAVAIP